MHAHEPRRREEADLIEKARRAERLVVEAERAAAEARRAAAGLAATARLYQARLGRLNG